MDNQLLNELKTAGANVDEALERFMGNEKLYEKFLKKFAEDPSYVSLLDAIEKEDNHAAFIAAHTLKGVCGNFLLHLFLRLPRRRQNFSVRVSLEKG